MDKPRSRILIALYVDQHAAPGFVRPPTAERVGFAERGDVFGTPIDHGQAVEMTAVFGGQGADERRPPARIETVLGVERAKTTEARVDDPELVVDISRELMDIDVAGDMNAARQIAGVVLSRRFQLFRHRRHIAILPDGISATDRQPVLIGDDAHRLCECSEVSVERAVVVANDDRFARLISRNDQADLKLLEQLWQIRSVYTAKIGGFFRFGCVVGALRLVAFSNRSASEEKTAKLLS